MASKEIRRKVERLIRMLASAIHVRGLYGDDHKITQGTVDALYSLLEEILKDTEEITIGVIGQEIAFEEEPFYELSKQMKGFIDHLKKLKAEKISLSKGIQKKEMTDFIGILSVKDENLENEENLANAFQSAGIKSIVFGKIGLKTDKEKKIAEEVESLIKADYQNGLDFFEKMVDDIKKDVPINIKSARQLANSIIRTLLKDKSLLLILTSTKSHDESTFVHDINVSIFTLLQAEALGLDQSYLHDIGTAALMHDAGKLSISADVLRKKGKLTEAERKEMMKHPINGAKILLETPGMSVIAALGAFEHHIWYNNTQGYPKGPFERKSNLISMMIEIADFYDAVRSRRYYRDEMAPEKTYEDMMSLSGAQFHPDLLKNFFSIIGIYPPGTLVALDTKEIGIVIKGSTLDIRRPQIEILYDNKGRKEDKSFMVNLLEKDNKGKFTRSIVKSLIITDDFKIPEKYQ